jgi:hypothetical protein
LQSTSAHSQQTFRFRYLFRNVFPVYADVHKTLSGVPLVSLTASRRKQRAAWDRITGSQLGFFAQNGVLLMSDELPVRLEDLQPDEIQELLEEEGIEATEEQVRMITAFIASVGGLENAQGLFDELRELRPAA